MGQSASSKDNKLVVVGVVLFISLVIVALLLTILWKKKKTVTVFARRHSAPSRRKPSVVLRSLFFERRPQSKFVELHIFNCPRKDRIAVLTNTVCLFIAADEALDLRQSEDVKDNDVLCNSPTGQARAVSFCCFDLKLQLNTL